jgi:hypothetical protein
VTDEPEVVGLCPRWCLEIHILSKSAVLDSQIPGVLHGIFECDRGRFDEDRFVDRHLVDFPVLILYVMSVCQLKDVHNYLGLRSIC